MHGGSRLKSVLLVESDGPKAAGFLHALERTGLTVVAIPEGERALDRARTQRPDLVVAASTLRDMSGFSLCNRLRRVPSLADLPIVLVSVEGDAAAVETHRSSRTPATKYLPPEAQPDDLVQVVQGVLGLDGQSGDSDTAGDEPLELEALPEDGSSDENERTVIQARPAVPPPLPTAPPPLAPPPLASAVPPPLAKKAPRADPFADLPPDPRLPSGASPEDKLQFFRERLKAKEDLLARVRDSYQVLRDDIEGAEKDLAGVRKESEERQRAREQAEQTLTQLRTENTRLSRELDAVQTELSRGVHETATLRQDAEERAQNLSQLLNETMQEREEANKEWSAKLADGERKLALLQEEVDHLASELDKRDQEVSALQGGAGELQSAMEEIRERSREETAVLAEKLEGLQAEKEALAADLSAAQASLQVKEADLASEVSRAESSAAAVTEVEAALQSARDEWAAERASLEQEQEEKLREIREGQEALEQRAAEAEAKQAELRGELEAVQEVEQQSAGVESRLAEVEAELSSRVDEVNGLRSELEQLGAQRDQLAEEQGRKEADAEARLANLTEQLGAKDRELQEAVSARSTQDSDIAQTRDEAERAEARAHSAEVELQRAEARARAAETEAAEAESRAREAATRAQDSDDRVAHLQSTLAEAEERVEAAQAAAAKAPSPGPSKGSNPPGSGDKALRVRVSDLTLELQALRAKLAQAQGTGLSAEVARLRDELESQRAENDFLTSELDRLQSGGS